MSKSEQPLLAELSDWLRIPSISTEPGFERELRRAAEWVCQRVTAVGGQARLVETAGNPLVVGRLDSSVPAARHVLLYGHYDVQGPGARELWDSDPFEPVVRGERIFARGASDDKGNFLPLLHTACGLFERGELPVNVTVLVEGEEELGSQSALSWLKELPTLPDAAIVFDAEMADAKTPALTVAQRGLVVVHVRVQASGSDLHSGLFGGLALNGLHALHSIVGSVLPDEGGELPEELRADISDPGEDLASVLDPGDEPQLLDELAAVPIVGKSSRDLARVGWTASLDLHQMTGGEAQMVIPHAAEATLSMRLGPGQSASAISEVLERRLRQAAPAASQLEISFVEQDDPVVLPGDHPVIKCASEALEAVARRPTQLVALGGSVPIVGALAARGVMSMVTGTALPTDGMHSANESFRLSALGLGEQFSRALLTRLAGL